MKLMKSGIELDAEKQQKIKGGYCVCFCDIGFITANAERVSVEGSGCACTCGTIGNITSNDHYKKY